MPRRFAALVLTATAVSALLGQSSPTPEETAVQRAVREAKENGVDKIEAVVFADPLPLRSLDEAASRYDFVIGVPIEAAVHVVDDDPSGILTFYKFRERSFSLRQQDRTIGASRYAPKGPFAELDLPEELLPLAPDEFLVMTSGGSVTIDGVELVSSTPHQPRFQMGETYLLIVNFVDREDRVAKLPMADYCVWRLQGDELTPLVPATRNPLARDVVALFRGSLRRLEFALPLRP